MDATSPPPPPAPTTDAMMPAAAAASLKPPLELTLIVAATSRNMGIGRAGALPWSGLRKEMAYFARVTKRLPPNAPPNALNAVVMGRRTWESIPPRFRPLRGRLNVVVSRAGSARTAAASEARPDSPVVAASSLAEAVRRLRGELSNPAESGKEAGEAGATTSPPAEVVVGRVFVIGGAQLYGAALGEGAEGGVEEGEEGGKGGGGRAKRVLLTRVKDDFECDVFFPLRLGEGEGGDGGEGKGGWARRSKQELDDWVGEQVPEGEQEEGGTRYEFEMWEKAE